jgi:hypothetical protein
VLLRLLADLATNLCQARGLLATALGLSPDCDAAIDATAKETVIATELEAETFNTHGHDVPLSMAYKNHFRTLKLALTQNVRYVCRLPSSPGATLFRTTVLRMSMYDRMHVLTGVA